MTNDTEYSYDNVLDSRNEKNERYFHGVEIPFEGWHVEVRRYPGAGLSYRVDLMDDNDLRSGTTVYPDFYNSANEMIREGVARALGTYQDMTNRKIRASAILNQIGF